MTLLALQILKRLPASSYLACDQSDTMLEQFEQQCPSAACQVLVHLHAFICSCLFASQIHPLCSSVDMPSRLHNVTQIGL